MLNKLMIIIDKYAARVINNFAFILSDFYQDIVDKASLDDINNNLRLLINTVHRLIEIDIITIDSLLICKTHN